MLAAAGIVAIVMAPWAGGSRLLVALIVALVIGSVWLAAWASDRVVERTRSRWGRRLARWQGLDSPQQLDAEELRWWRKGRRADLTEADAEAWAIRGLPVELAGVAAVRGVDLDRLAGLVQI